MRALYLSGRQADALRTFQRFRQYLADETGLDPSDALVELDHRIAQGDPTLAPGSAVALPGYELAEVIGEGAFGSVYRAVQPSVGREVAVKVIRAELADDPRFVQRFEAEAQLVARIEHPHVVPLYDFWRRPGGAFLVFRLLRGGSLTDREAKGPLGLAEASRLVDELGGALLAAHALGVVHRDVKPANILFDEADNSYLADFGIAQFGPEGGDIDLRSAGSPLYASPEQFRDATASPASDQYSLAVVLWEALSGRAPFAGTTTTALGSGEATRAGSGARRCHRGRFARRSRPGEGDGPAPPRPLSVDRRLRRGVAHSTGRRRRGPYHGSLGRCRITPVGDTDVGEPRIDRGQSVQGPPLVPGGRRCRVLRSRRPRGSLARSGRRPNRS